MLGIVRSALIVATLWLVFTPIAADARVTSTVKLRYITEDGPSRWVEREVDFMTGDELNDAVGSFSRYQMYKSYAVIWFGEGQAAVVLLDISTFGCPMKFTATCFPTFSSSFKGTDQGGREWEFCTGTFC